MSIRQYSTINALMLGHYYGSVKVSEALKHGDLGLGALENLNGECLIIDGKCYCGLPGGAVAEVHGETQLAFCTVGDFSMAGTIFQANGAESMADVWRMADDVRQVECESDNIPCICRIDGKFSKVLVRSFREQRPPFRPLSEVCREQIETLAEDIDGTLIGFWFPKYLGGVNQDGWHLHFISRDRKTFGGHCLDCKLVSGLIGCRKEPNFTVILPSSEQFRTLNLAQDLSAQRDAVENSSQKKE